MLVGALILSCGTAPDIEDVWDVEVVVESALGPTPGGGNAKVALTQACVNGVCVPVVEVAFERLPEAFVKASSKVVVVEGDVVKVLASVAGDSGVA